MNRRIFDISMLSLFLVLALLQGYEFGSGDLALYVPLVRHLHDPQLFSNDLLMQSLTAYGAPLWRGMSLLLGFMEASTAFFLLFLVQTAIIVFALRYFYRRFFGDNAGWVLFLLMLVLSRSSGAMNTFGLNPFNYFQPCAAALGMTLFMYGAIDAGRWKTGGIIAGSMFLYHPITAIWASMLFFLRALIDDERPITPNKAAGALLLLLCGLPYFIPFALNALAGAHHSFDTGLWVGLAKMRLSHCFFLSRWVPDRFVHLGLVIAGLIIFRHHPVFRRTLPIIIGTGIAVLTTAVAELFSIRMLLQLNLLRCTYFVYILFFTFTAWRVSHADPAWTRPRNALWTLAAFLLMLWPLLERRPTPLLFVLLALSIVAAACHLIKRPMPLRGIVIATGFMIVAAASIVALNNKHAATGVYFNTVRTGPWAEMQVWVREHIEPGATIMTPPYIEGFRSYSNHAIFGDYKDGGSHLFNTKTIFTWWERMQGLGLVLFMKTTDFPAAYHKNALAAARASGIDYVVFDKQHSASSLQPLYENRGFGIIRLTDSVSFLPR